MQYVIADIHGCYTEFIGLLNKIGFSDDDELFVLGDAMDRGPEPIKVIHDLMHRPNVTYILGNHDDMMLRSLRKLAVDISETSLMELSTDDLMSYYHWLSEGGAVTAEQFCQLPREERGDVLDFLECAAAYEMIEDDGKLYILVHAGIHSFDPDKEMDEYSPYDFLWERMDYSKQYFPCDRIFLVTGHTPTTMIREDQKPLVYQENGHIALDCGCVFGGNLAAYCIETGEIVYIPHQKHR